MSEPIKYRGARYYPYTLLPGPGGAAIARDIQTRQSFVSSEYLKLDRTCGVYLPLGGQSVLFIIDLRTIIFDNNNWRLIAKIAAQLVKCWTALSDDAKLGLKSLYAVTFTTSPNRSYADVKPKTFVYDVDEFWRSATLQISAAYGASNIVHDAFHIHQFETGSDYTGPAAEKACWKLQIANAGALELADDEVAFLKSLVANPASVGPRLASDPYGSGAKVACSIQGKCTTAVSGLTGSIILADPRVDALPPDRRNC